MTLRRSRARAAAGLAAWLALNAVSVAAQDSIAQAEKLYQSAYYEEALSVLDRLKNEPAAQIAQYRVLCLLALGRNDEAQRGIESILRLDPRYRPSEEETSPRIRAVFESTRRRLLPQIFQERYEAAKATFERKEFESAVDQFNSLLALLDDPTLMGEDSRADFRLVVSGFADLARAAAAKKKESVAAVPAPPVGTPPAPDAVATPRIYAAGAVGVVPPVAISKPLPPLPRENTVLLQREYVGVLDIIVDEQGNVSEVTVRKSVHPQFDGKLVRTVRTWKFRPAMKDGRAVSYRSVFEVKLVP